MPSRYLTIFCHTNTPQHATDECSFFSDASWSLALGCSCMQDVLQPFGNNSAGESWCLHRYKKERESLLSMVGLCCRCSMRRTWTLRRWAGRLGGG